MTVTQKVGLTGSEKAALKAFRVAKKKAGMPPELQEVAAEMGVTYKRVEQILKSLVDKGRMKKVARYRGYRLVKKAA
jgi:DNA-binding MarR family transcriptional regulator